MKLFSHYSVRAFSNSYIVGPDDGGDAVVIDPAGFDVDLLALVEDHGLYLRYALITQPDDAHARGIKTICKIYDIEIFAALASLYSIPCTRLATGERRELGGYSVRALGMPAHSRDSLVFDVEGMLFSGNALSAGTIGDVENAYAKALLSENVTSQLAEYLDGTPVFPSYGPPTTLGIERRSNPQLMSHAEGFVE